MVVDPFTSISLAGNIFQFIDYSLKLFSEAKTIYKSASGVTTEHASLSAVATDLRDFCDQLDGPSGRSPSNVDTEIGSIATECAEVSEKLVGIITKIKAKKEHSKWESFRAALKAVRHEDEIKALASQLTQLESRARTRSLRMLM